MHGTCHSWNAIRTICEAFHQDEMFDLKVIIGYDSLNGNKDARCIHQVKREGYPFYLWDEYDVKNDQPNILILNHPYDFTTQFSKMGKCADLVIVASMLLIRNEDTWDVFLYSKKRIFKISARFLYL